MQTQHMTTTKLRHMIEHFNLDIDLTNLSAANLERMLDRINLAIDVARYDSRPRPQEPARKAQDGEPTRPCPVCGKMPEQLYRTESDVRYYGCNQHPDDLMRDAGTWNEYAGYPAKLARDAGTWDEYAALYSQAVGQPRQAEQP